MFKDSNQIDDFFGLKPEDKDKDNKKSIKEIINDNVGSRSRMKLLPKILSKKERYIIFVLALVIIGSLIAVPFTVYNHLTKEVPAYGGGFVEGVVGEPHYINPLLSQANDADRDLVNLIYSGLLKYNEDGKLVPDLARSYEISSDGLNYTVYLKPNAVWQDGQPVTANDVIFTIQTAQDSDYGSPQLINWQGVEIEKIDDYTLMFKLKNKYAQFLNNLTLGILPEHIWQNVKPINFALSDFNIKPIGSGPFEFSKFQKDSSGDIQIYDLVSNKDFYDGRPHINNVRIRFYNSEDEMIAAYNRNEIQNLSFISAENVKKIKFQQRMNIQKVELPRYFAVFMNANQNSLLADKNIRLALNYATDKQEIINTVLDGNGSPVNSPLIDGVLGINPNVKKYDYDPDMAKQILATTGWANPNDKGILTKKNQTLTFQLTTSVWPELAQAADILKTQWAKAGIDVEIQALPTPQLQQTIKERSYQMLLFGEILNLDPDPFSLWHSSQTRDPGLNLAMYQNKTADSLLENARQTLNPLERMQKYDDFQNIVIEDVPAVFLYNPLFIYGQIKDIKGFNSKIISMPSDRFSNIESWYIKTKRVWK